MNLARLEEYGRGRRKRTQTAKYSEVESQAKMDKSGKDIENPTADEKDELKDTDFVPMADHASDDDESVKDQDVDIISEGVVIASALPTTTTTAALVQSTQPLPQPPLMAPKPLVHSPLQGASAPQQAPSVIGGQHGTEPPPKVQHQPIQVPLSVSDDMSPQSKAELGVFFKSIIRKFYAMVSMKLSVGYKPMSEPENIFNTTVPMQEWNTSVGNSSFYLLSKCPICSRPGHRLDVCPAILNPDIVAMLKAMFRLKGAYQDSTMVALIDWYNSQYRLFHIRKRMSSNQGGGQLGMAPHKPANTTQIRPPHAAPTTPQSAATSRGNRSPHPQPQHIQQGSGYILPGSNHAIVDKNALADIMRRLEQLEKGKQVQELRSDFNAINQNILNAQISNILQGNLATNPQQIQQLPLSATGSAVYSAAYNTPRQLYSQMATPSPIPPPVSSPAFTQQFTQNLGYVQHPQVSAGAYIVPQPLRPGFQASPQSSAQGVHLAAGSVSATSGFVHAPKYMHAPFGYNDGGETSKAVVTSTADIDPSSQAPGIKNQSSTSSPKLNSGITEVGSVNSSAAPRTPAEATNAHTAPTNNRDNMSLQSASYTLNGQNGIQQKKVPFFDMKCPLCMAGNHDPEICPNRFNAEALEQQYDRLLNSSLANTA
ncbi:hypothetical protein EV182_003268, partial [Spiromyces aspiralis]